MNKKFNEHLNMKHDNIKFTNEKVVNESLPFLDLLISRNKKGFTRIVYISLRVVQITPILIVL